jgi:hypothetical protein
MPEHRRSPEIERLVQALTRGLTEAVESAIDARARVLTEEYMRAAMAEAPSTEPSLPAMPGPASPTVGDEPLVVMASPGVAPLRRRSRPKRPPVVAEAKAIPAIDPEEARRAAELARLRAILRPPVSVLEAPPIIVPPPAPAAEEDGGLRALEDQIRDQIPALAGLSQSRYTARIAAWVGRVRLHQSGPDGERTRIASRMLFEKLRSLAWSMEAGTIEGLTLSWSTRNWERYIEDKELIAATPEELPLEPEPDADVPPAAEPAAEPGDVWSTPGEADGQA